MIAAVGEEVGNAVGTTVGETVGLKVVGATVGESVGKTVGLEVVGETVGLDAVGAEVVVPWFVGGSVGGWRQWHPPLPQKAAVLSGMQPVPSTPPQNPCRPLGSQ